MKTFELKDFIKTKESACKHTEEEINFFIKNLTSFSQEEITQWLKAVKANDLDDKETSVLTLAMANSGEILNWEGLEPTIDKHSTGGIGDKVTLLFAPVVAAYGLKIPKLSGRGLGITGGTIDKLESISGLKTNLTIAEIKEQIKKIGLVIASASSNIAPADKKLYAIRDVTDTVDSIPLIASSIMSKKIAGGSKNIILDVKFGSGAFMKSFNDAKLLAQKMVSIGKNLERNMKAVISNMDEPLGYAIGNALEIKEVLDVLSGKEVDDLVEITITLAREVITLIDTNEGGLPGARLLDEKLQKMLLNGNALKKFESMITAQGGDLANFDKTHRAKHVEILKSEATGYIQSIDALSIGEAVHNLGAGRKQISDKIDHSVGIILHKKHGDKIIKDEPLLEIHAKNKDDAGSVKQKLLTSVIIGQNKQHKLKLVREILCQ